MTRPAPDLISAYFDEDLSAEEYQELQNWLRSSPDHRRAFARATLLHDNLRAEQLALSLGSPASISQKDLLPVPAPHRRNRSLLVTVGLLLTLAVVSLVWLEVGTTSASAAVELTRLISAQNDPRDKTYEIDVEEIAVSRKPRESRSEDHRPPKPPLDGAILHVRQGRQFVLIRDMENGMPFITGSNGLTSWAIRPDGPVRFSRDISRFSRDLPGHEQDIPLIQIEDGLKQIRSAYHVELLPIEESDDSAPGIEPTRLLVAVKKRGYRGPNRIEISYAVSTGQIRQMRFVEMPYGPERLTLRMTLIEERPLSAHFFDYQSHCPPHRIVEEE